MEGNSAAPRKAQLDKKEREHLEDVVTEMRERVEANVHYQLEEYDLEDRPDEDASLSDEEEDLVEAIKLEAVDGNNWDDGYEQYITSVGYTIVNRLAALRCMEVRGFIDDEVTRFRGDGLTPAADRLVTEDFMLEEEAVLEAYRNACDDLAEEIEILFDRSSAYSLIDPDDDTFEDLCGMLDKVTDEVWQADDVLGWVYEYYNVKLLDDLRQKGDREGLEPEDVPAANQFYTPHWVVRMLTDNSLGKLYLEDRGELQETVERQDSITPDERKNRPLSPNESPDIADFCTYLVPSEEEGEPSEFDGPEDIRVIDPACGSGHFLLYAFDVLERIYRAETDLDHAEIPREILRNNLYGVDLDMRACQLAAFNLYLKGRTRAEAEGASGFDMPEVGIVCADAKVADIEGVEEVFDEVADGKSDVEDALRRILDAFEEVHGLGSLLDVRGTLGDLFEDEVDEGSVQIKLDDDPREDHTLGQILHSLREAVDQRREDDSFLAQDLRSFVRLLDVLAQDYDVALMNPPYGSRNRMPESIKGYIREKHQYPAEFYVNFYEVCERLSKSNGRIGMLVPQSFLLKDKFKEFRSDFVNGTNSFDFLAEFGRGILDNATVRTAGTVTRAGVVQEQPSGDFIRLHDVEPDSKEEIFRNLISGQESEVKRRYIIDLQEFSSIPGNTICYSIPRAVRELHNSELKLDAEQAGIDGDSVGVARQGVATANNSRFLRKHWETNDFGKFYPIASGGSDAWVAPQVPEVVDWDTKGETIKRSSPTIRTPNESLYGKEGLTWTRVKKTGRRFGYYPGGLFSDTGYLFVPEEEYSLWNIMSVVNSTLYHSLFLSLSTERNWNSGDVGRIPWYDSLNDLEEVEDIAKEQFDTKVTNHQSNPISPYYVGPEILPEEYLDDFFYSHPHTKELFDSVSSNYGMNSVEESIIFICRSAKQEQLRRESRMIELFKEINELVYDELGIPDSVRDEIINEVYLRTLESPEDRQVPRSRISP